MRKRRGFHQQYNVEDQLPEITINADKVSEHETVELGVHKKKWKQIIRKVCLVSMILAVFSTVLWFIYLLLPLYCIKYEVMAEAGDTCPEITEFLNWENTDACFVSDINDKTVLNDLGDYGVVIYAYGRRSASVIHVRDTIAPTVTTKDVCIYSGTEIQPDDFIESIIDRTKTSVRFQKQPDYETIGIRTVTIEVEDEGKNITEVKAELEVIHDNEPPQINGVEEITITANESVQYKKGVTVTDNCDKDIKLVIDTKDVNTSKAGDYSVTYSATDSAGNNTIVSTILHVKPITVETVTEEIINAEADKLLSEILNETMTPYEKAETIYWWCHDHIAYSNGASKNNWVEGAYQGILEQKGDCYTYAMTAKCLLTRAGIKNMDIEKIRKNNSMHYWNLVELGEGWHHFDATRRADGATFFYLTDEELMKYSQTHNGTHNYDRELYPKIK